MSEQGVPPSGSGHQPSASAVPASRSGVPNAGDRLWSVPADSRYRQQAGWVVVQKVGRKWATFGYDFDGREIGRCDKETLAVDGGAYSPSIRLYRSEEDYRDKLERDRLWSGLRALIDQQYSCPAHLTNDDLAALVRKLER